MLEAPLSQAAAPRLRILHVVPSYFPAVRYGGPIYSVHGLCKALARRGHEVWVYTTNVDGPGVSDVPLEAPVNLDGVLVRYFPVPALRRLYWSPAMGAALGAEANTFDIVHNHSVFLWPTWAAARAARRAGVPYLLAPRGMLVRELILRKSRWLKSAWIALIERRNIAGAAAIHTTSALETRDMNELGLYPRQVHMIPNGVDLDDPRAAATADASAALPPQAAGPFALFIGRINWKKGLDRLIPALAHLPQMHLLVAGNDEENYRPALEKLAREHGVAARVAFLGPVYDATKQVLLARAIALVLPSYSENFGNVVMEAMAAGCPVVVTPEVGAADIVRQAGAGLVSAGDPPSLARALASLADAPAERASMGERGRRCVAERYSWDACAQAMEGAYLAHARRAGSAPAAAKPRTAP